MERLEAYRLPENAVSGIRLTPSRFVQIAIQHDPVIGENGLQEKGELCLEDRLEYRRGLQYFADGPLERNWRSIDRLRTRSS
jgi:hypothetical protein